MPTLLQSLPVNDPAFLRIIAELWGLELESDPTPETLSGSLLTPGLIHEIVDSLPDEAKSALFALSEAGGRLPWAAFTRRFGEIRDVGPGRRDRQKIYLQPVSAAEALYYRALLARAFFDTPSGPQEFAYIPDDLLPHIRRKISEKKDETAGLATESEEPLGRPASPRECEYPISASDRLLDDLTTLLAALRLGMEPPHAGKWRYPLPVLMEFLVAAQLTTNGALRSDAVRSFLEAPRKEALGLLVKSWRESREFNELRQAPGLICEGAWQNDPLETRQSILNLLGNIPRRRWWSLSAFIRAVKERYPDFQRPAGDYDSWFIKRASDGVYLHGFERWDEVEGALLRYFITGPLFWLGMADLAAPGEGESVTAFRLVPQEAVSILEEGGKLHVSSQGKIAVPRTAPRSVRYQIARFCEWDEEKPEEYHYSITTHSLKQAQAQGLKVNHLLSLLAKHASGPVPPALIKALKRWEVHGTEARVERRVILRVSRPEVLEELRASRASRFLGELLSQTAVVVKGGAVSQVLSALTEMGLLAEDSDRSDIIVRESNHK